MKKEMKYYVKLFFTCMVICSQIVTVLATDGPNTVITGGMGATFAVKKDGTLWAYGDTKFGQLGIATTEETAINPVKIMSGVKSVVSSEGNTYIIKQDNTLWGMGLNGGNFGNGTTGRSDTPIKLMDDVKMVATCVKYTLIIKMDGSLWGTNNVPGFADGDDTRFKPILAGEVFKFISVNGYYCMAIKENGELWGWGNNDYGALGTGDLVTVDVPKLIMENVAFVSSESESAMIIKEDSTLWMTGTGYNGKIHDGTKVVVKINGDGILKNPLKIMDNVLYVACSGNRWWVIKRDNTLWGWGSDNQFGLLSDYAKDTMIPTKVMDNVSYISAGDRHIVVLKTDQTLWTAGQNATGGIAGKPVAYKSYPLQQDMTSILDAPSPWAVSEVNEAIDKGLIPIELQNDYTKSITRQEFAKLVVTMIEKKSGKTIADYIADKGLVLETASPFSDVNDSYVTAAYTLSIVNGVGGGLFDPKKTINREEAAKMLTSTATALGYATTAPAPSFDDSEKISTWAKPFIGYMVNIGVMKGSANRFDPKGTYVRQMAFVTMNRIFENLN